MTLHVENEFAYLPCNVLSNFVLKLKKNLIIFLISLSYENTVSKMMLILKVDNDGIG